jgi:hypothetical protein
MATTAAIATVPSVVPAVLAVVACRIRSSAAGIA